MDQIKENIFNLPELKKLGSLLHDKKNIYLAGISGSFRAFLAAYLLEQQKKPILYIANDLDSAERLRDDAELILGRDAVAFLPAIAYEPYEHVEPNPSQISLRMEATQKFIESESWLAVATIEGIMEHFPMPEDFLDNQIYLKTGNSADFNRLLQQLNDNGLRRQDLVENVGDFSVRGGIVDLFAWNYEEPLRIEFFGNEIDSIRNFDVISQRSINKLDEVTILPNLKHKKSFALIDQFLPESTVLFCEDKQLIDQKIAEYFNKACQIFEKHKAEGVEEVPAEDIYLAPEKYEELLNKHAFLDSGLVRSEALNVVSFNVKPPPDFNGSIKMFLEYLTKQSALKEAPAIILQSVNPAQSDRLREIIEEEDIAVSGQFMVGTLHNGFAVPTLNFEILTDHEIFQRFKRRKTYKRFKSGEYLRQLSSLNVYDFVVHIDYGIGQYLGMEKIEFGSVTKECLRIAYRDGDHLFVTVDRLNRVQKFSSEEGVTPKLTKLGSPEWERTKAKTKESLKKVAAELIRIYAGRKAQGGYHFKEDSHWQKELEASFIYEETEDQLKSIAEVKQDMESEQPMDRLLCGDVGFGKTEVALRAAFKAVVEGKQAAVLVPTTILAFQHYETFRTRLKEFPVNVEMLNRFRTKKEQNRIIEELASGQVDLVIGTHRIISDDIKFKDLGLLVVDEEQRFGVRQKEKLKKYRLSVDILSMTATPIPRTLHMALMGARDLSNIDTPPGNRLPVHTEIINWDDDQIYDIISKEIARGGQVYFVHNRVETILAVKETLQQIVPQARIAIGHGQLPERSLERVMLDFMHKEYDVLIATMIIENGLDIPNVNSIIINRADKFGLSQLYQLRGRVGRSKEQAYAYLLVPPMDKLTEISRKRLRAIQDFTDLGSGYKVALRDLEIRGAGNLLGKEQSGFVQTVGFELYCKILDEAVKELKEGVTEEGGNGELEEQPRIYTDPKLDVDYDLLIPEDYISTELERITIYHRLVNFSNIEQVENLKSELEDRFGKPPAEVFHFLATIEVKILASHLYASRIILSGDKLKLFFSEDAQNDDRFFKESIPRLMNQKKTTVNFLNQKDLGVQIKLIGSGRLEKLDFAKKILETIVGND